MPIIKTLKNGVWTPVNSIDTIATATPTTAGLMSASDKAKLDGVGTIELLKEQTLTTTTTTYTLDTGKSFTDYSFILIENMVAGETRARNSCITAYNVGGGALIQTLHGGLTGELSSGWKVSAATITFASATTFTGGLGASGAINQVKIYGVK